MTTSQPRPSIGVLGRAKLLTRLKISVSKVLQWLKIHPSVAPSASANRAHQSVKCARCVTSSADGSESSHDRPRGGRGRPDQPFRR